MNSLHIYCDQSDFSAVENAFGGEFVSDVPLAAELLFVDAEEIRSLNSQHRGKDSVTDVLSFPTLENICGKELKKADFPSGDCMSKSRSSTSRVNINPFLASSIRRSYSSAPRFLINSSGSLYGSILTTLADIPASFRIGTARRAAFVPASSLSYVR